MNWPKLVVLIKHGESVGYALTADKRSKLDIPNYEFPLTDRGVEESRIAKEYLNKNLGVFNAYFTSYYKRAIETMKIIYPEVKFREDPRLAELNRGIWSSMTQKEIKAEYPGEIERKEKEGVYVHRPIGGENCPDAELRILSFINDLKTYWANKKILIVGHVQCFILFQRIVHPLSIVETIAKFESNPFDNASVTIYERVKIGSRYKLELVQENIVPWKGIL